MQPDKGTEEYFDSIQKEVERAYSLAKLAREEGKDPAPKVEIPLAEDLAARVEGLVSTFFPELLGSGLKEAIRVLEEKHGKNDERVALLIGRKVSQGKFSKLDSIEKAADAALRVAVAYLTLGVVTAPLEGISSVKLKENDDKSKYLAVYYAGPIRSAGGTASAVSVLAADFIRKGLGIAEYKPTEAEVNRYYAEVEDYYNRVAAKQYHPSKEEISFIIKNVPVEITGDPTEEIEVSNYKDLPRVETNKIRGGMCLVLLDGIPLKAEKILGRVKKYPPEYCLGNWMWLADFVALKKKMHAEKKPELKDGPKAQKYTPSNTYLSKVVAGRPILSHPSRPGGFRLRLGRSRTGGLASTSVHPAAMYLTEFAAVGTQLATEFPGKATVCTPCDSIEPPVVKLRSGSVVELSTEKEVAKCRQSVSAILSMGDILVPYGEFVSNNHMLLPPGYCEEWWLLEAKKAGADVSAFASEPPALEGSIRMSRDSGIPLHPKYNFFWHDISTDNMKELIRWLSSATVEPDKILLKKSAASRILERLCVPFTAGSDEIILEGKSLAVFRCLGSPAPETAGEILSKISDELSPAENIFRISGIKVRDRGPTRVGIRMGRPEKAEKRLLKGRPQILFPCGDEGGKMRNLMVSYAGAKITAEFPVFKCASCGEESPYKQCFSCGSKNTEQLNVCTECGRRTKEDIHCHRPTKKYARRTINPKKIMDAVFKSLGIDERPKLFKGVRGVSGPDRNIERLEKGVLRTQYDLYVNKDGTTRYDSTDVPITHFKPKEVGVSIEKLKSLGYVNDADGAPLESPEQVLELKVQDIIISDNNEFSSVDYLISVANFVDELLVKFYGLSPFYNIKTKEDLAGQLVIGLAPHTSAGIVGRIVGFTPAKICFAHPFWHAGKRRNCFFGDEKILVYDGRGYHLQAMRELIDNNLVGEIERDGAGTEYKKVSGLKAFAFNKKTKKFELADITHVSKHPAPGKMLEIKTKSGRKIIVTWDHPLLNRRREKVRAAEATEVLVPWNIENPAIREAGNIDLLDVVNDSDVMIRTGGAVFNSNVPLSQLSGNLGMSYKTLTNYIYRKSYPLQIIRQYNKDVLKNKNYFLGSKRDKVSIKPEILLNEDFLCVLGFYIAEGYTKKNQKDTHQISITATKPWAKEFLTEKIRTIFGLNANVSGHTVTICSRFVHELFQYLKAGKDARSKRVPDVIYSLPNELIGAFLRGYFSGDGSVSLQSTLEINVTSVNKWLIDSTSMLLMFFGIRHSIYEENREIKSEIILKFYGKPKKIHAYKIRIYGDEARKFIEQIGFVEEKQVRAKELLTEWLNKKSTGRTKFCGNAFIDKIVEKRIIENNEKYVYDVTIDKHHNMISSGIVAGNCDGDEDSVLLLMDALLNFSRKFLPDTRGGRTMDAPLVLTSKLNPEEVDDEAWRVDISPEYPLELFEEACQYKYPSELTKKPKIVADVIKTPEVFHIKFTHDTASVNAGPLRSKYVELGSMMDKVAAQLDLAEKAVAVDKDKSAELIISKHFLRDIKGNLRTFSRQQLRCTNCNAKYRRPPLAGKCKCGSKLQLTVSEGAVRKYLEPTKHIVEKYKISPYLAQQLSLIERDVDELFGKKDRQLGLAKFR